MQKTIKKTFLASAVAGSLLASGASFAAEVAGGELTANVAALTNYYFRGVTQTGDSAAVQGGLDWGHSSGIYLGTWGSNIDFGGKEDMEIDVYGGYAGEIGEFGYDIGALYYWYPGSGGDKQDGELDYAEVTVSASYSIVSAGIAYTVWGESDEDEDLFKDGDVYYFVSGDYELGQGYSVGGIVGLYTFDADGENDLDADYTHWGLSLSKDAGDFGAFTLAYEQTNGDEDDGVATDENPNFWLGWSTEF